MKVMGPHAPSSSTCGGLGALWALMALWTILGAFCPLFHSRRCQTKHAQFSVKIGCNTLFWDMFKYLIFILFFYLFFIFFPDPQPWRAVPTRGPYSRKWIQKNSLMKWKMKTRTLWGAAGYCLCCVLVWIWKVLLVPPSPVSSGGRRSTPQRLK